MPMGGHRAHGSNLIVSRAHLASVSGTDPAPTRACGDLLALDSLSWPCRNGSPGLQAEHTVSLLSMDFAGVSGHMKFSNYADAGRVRRDNGDPVRVSILTQPTSSPRPNSLGKYPALSPVATVTISNASGTLMTISDNVIVWPSKDTFPPMVPLVDDVRRHGQVAAEPAPAPAMQPPPMQAAGESPQAAASNEGIIVGLAVLGAVVAAMLLLCMAYVGMRLWRGQKEASVLGLAGGRGRGHGSAVSSRYGRGAAAGGAALGSTGDDIAGVQYVEMLYGNGDSSLAPPHRGGWSAWLPEVLKGPRSPPPPTGKPVSQYWRGGVDGGEPLAPGSLVNIGTSGGMWEVVGLGGRSAGGSLTPSEDASAGVAAREAPGGHAQCVVPLVPISKRVSRAGAESDTMDTRRSASSVTGSGTSALQVTCLLLAERECCAASRTCMYPHV